MQLRRPLVRSAGRGPVGPADHLRAGGAPRAWASSSSAATSTPRSASPARSQRRHPRAPACQPGRRARAANARATGSTPESRWVPHAHRQDRAVLGDVAGRAGYPPLPAFEEPRNQPALASRPGRALPAGPHVCEVAVVLRDPAPQHRQCAEQSTRTAGRDPSRRGESARHNRRRLGAAGSPRRTAAYEHEPN